MAILFGSTLRFACFVSFFIYKIAKNPESSGQGKKSEVPQLIATYTSKFTMTKGFQEP